MSHETDNPDPEADNQAPETEKKRRDYHQYSDEEIYRALVALDLNGGNINRTAIGLGMSWSTLQRWSEEYQAGKLHISIQRGVKEARGDMADKLESLLHDIVESAPAKLAKATFSQAMVGFGIGADKLRLLREHGVRGDADAELCALFGLAPSQFPDRLTLKPGDEVPAMFMLDSELRPIIDVQLVPTSPDDLPTPSIPELEPIPPDDDAPSDLQSLLDSIIDDDNDNPSN